MSADARLAGPPSVATVLCVPDVCWKFWCRWCRREHHHGALAGHRTAHCVTASPYQATGYVLEAPT